MHGNVLKIVGSLSFVLAAGLPCAVGAQVLPIPGAWEGVTSEGLAVSFEVTEDSQGIAAVAFNATLDCTFGPVSRGKAVGFGNPPRPIVDGAFDIEGGAFNGAGLDSGDSSGFRLRGAFSDPAAASGSLSQLDAVFSGIGDSTQACSRFGVTWTATPVGRRDAAAAPGIDEQYRAPMPVTTGTLGQNFAGGEAVVPEDGVWSGRTSQNETFTLTVSEGGTMITGRVAVTVECSDGPFATQVGFSTVAIDDGGFGLALGFVPGQGLEAGVSTGVAMNGVFADSRSASGAIFARSAVFTGVRAATESCAPLEPLRWSARFSIAAGEGEHGVHPEAAPRVWLEPME